MKKLLNRLLKKNNLPLSSRITSETIAQHRERILAGGRRFKYPIQYARHRLVINAIIISVVALVAVIVVGWWQLYSVQNSSDFMYRVTKVVPVPVAVVDGQSVLFSDYLLKYRSSIRYKEQKEQIDFNTSDGKKQAEYLKQQSMADAIADAYASKLAKSLDLSVSASELEGSLKDQRQSSDGETSTQTNDAVIADYYGWSQDEYRHITEVKLLRRKVAYAVDNAALGASNSVAGVLKSSPSSDFKTLADTISSQTGVKATYGVSGWVPRTNQDGGLAVEAAKLSKLQVSGSIKSTLGKSTLDKTTLVNGYYFVRLLDINDTSVSYEYIQIPLTKFTEDLNSIMKSDKVKKYITI